MTHQKRVQKMYFWGLNRTLRVLFALLSTANVVFAQSARNSYISELSYPNGTEIILDFPQTTLLAATQEKSFFTFVATSSCDEGTMKVIDAQNDTYQLSDDCGNKLSVQVAIAKGQTSAQNSAKSGEKSDIVVKHQYSPVAKSFPLSQVKEYLQNQGITPENIQFGVHLELHWTIRGIFGNDVAFVTDLVILPESGMGFSEQPKEKVVACSALLHFDTPKALSALAEIVQFDYEDDYNLDACGAGTVTRTWVALDAQGNSDTASQLITVLADTEKPQISLPVTHSTIDCNGNLPNIKPTATDNCTYHTDLVIKTEDKQWGQTIERTYTAADECGNTSSVVLQISLKDNLPPVITGLTDKTISELEPIQFDTPTATDGCRVESLTHLDKVDYHSAAVVHIRTWTAIDVAGNVATAQQKITVLGKSDLGSVYGSRKY
jgi:hypothetical protein